MPRPPPPEMFLQRNMRQTSATAATSCWTYNYLLSRLSSDPCVLYGLLLRVDHINRSWFYVVFFFLCTFHRLFWHILHVPFTSSGAVSCKEEAVTVLFLAILFLPCSKLKTTFMCSKENKSYGDKSCTLFKRLQKKKTGCNSSV